MNQELERALSALHSLDPSMNRESWVRVGMAAKDAGIALDDFIEWSSNGANFRNAKDCAVAWQSFKTGGVTKSTLFHCAREMGWRDPGKPLKTAQEAIAGLRGHNPTHKRPTALQEPRSPSIRATDLWAAAHPADDTHPYIIRKNGNGGGLRVLPDAYPGHIQGQSLAGCLVVPVRSNAGELRTLQLIPPTAGAKKLNLPSHQFQDGMFTLGDVAGTSRAYIVEGIGQAWAVRSVSEDGVVVSFGAGRMGTVCHALRQAFPDKALVIVSDRGKEAEAERIAKQVGAMHVAMPQHAPPNFDISDLRAERGSEAVREALAAARMPSCRFTFKRADDLLRSPPMVWAVKGILPAQGLACMFGASGSGKSFLALDLCAAIAGGREWFGRKVNQCPVVYVALEGEQGLAQRVKAWQTEHESAIPSALRFVTESLDIRDAEDRAELLRAVLATGGAGGLLVIDTLNRAATGADENSSRDMGEIVGAAKEIQQRLGGAVLLIHHSGKDQSKGLRGHSSLHAALDAAIEVVRSDTAREWRVAKAKDENDSHGEFFGLRVVDLGLDADGQPITSCVVERQAASRPALKAPQGATQRLVHNALGKLLRESTAYGRGNAPKTRPCLALEAAVEEVAQALTCRPDQRQFQARRAITAMVSRGMYQVSEGWLWDCQ